MELRVELRKAGLFAVAVLGEGPFEADEATNQVSQRLTQLGVRPQLDAERLRTALAPLGASEPPAEGVVVAKGTPPQPGVDAQVLPLFPIRSTPPGEEIRPFVTYMKNVVYPGDVIMERTPPASGTPGKNLLGEEIPAPLGKDISVIAGNGVEEKEDGTAYRALTYGVALYFKNRLEIVEAIRVSEDLMEAYLTVLPDSRLEETAHVAKILDSLHKMEVSQGIKREVLVAAVRKARRDGKPVPDVLIAQGKRPRNGREMDYKLLVNPDKTIGKELEGGRIDFRESESVKNVSKGELIAEVIPAVEPEPGYQVDGTLLRPKTLRAEGLKPGQNTAPSEDQKGIVADADGMLLVQGGKFHVADQYLVQGDVDYRTGNIRATGSVTVRGHVKPGFQVVAGKEIEIFGDVEDAKVESGASLVVRGGITADSRVITQGNVSAKFLLNSYVETAGDLEIKLSVTNCEIYAKGKISVAGSQGAIVGGEVNAAMGIEARTIGSGSAKTHIAVGVDLRVIREMQAIDKEREHNQESFRHLQASLGKQFLKDPRAALEAIPPPLRKTKLELLQKLQELLKRDKELATRREELERRNAEMKNAQVVVQGEIFAGTVVTICQLRHVLKENLRRVVLYYDAGKNEVAWRRG